MTMKHILIIVLGIVILTNCSNGTSQEKQGKRELVPNPEKYEHDGYSNLADTLPTFIPDTTIGKISLINSTNIDEYLGSNSMDRLTKLGESEGLPHIEILSCDKKQRLTVFFHPGGVINEFSEFKVTYNNGNDRNLKIVTDKEFETENKIKLGITIGDLKSIKGEPDIISDNSTVLQYKIIDFENSDFLKKYNYPSYYADYKFENGYLVEFRFGFEYP